MKIFSYGAVSMAHKTNSKIVPFAITGDYKFRSKNLTVRIGKSIEANDDLEESNKRLRKAIINLIKENDKYSGKQCKLKYIITIKQKNYVTL